MVKSRAGAKRTQALGGAVRPQFRHKKFARQTLPRYERDDGPLTDEQMAAIDRLVPQKGFVGDVKRLF